MTASYEFLRLLEHRLQLQRLKRTHMLPEIDDDEALYGLYEGVARTSYAADWIAVPKRAFFNSRVNDCCN